MQTTASRTVSAPPDLARLPLAEYAPVSKLRLERTRVERPRFGAIDFHTHLGRWLTPGADWVASDLAGRRHDAWAIEVDAYLEICDRHSIETSINLDGGWDAELEANLDRLDRAHPGRFATFCQLDWTRATAGEGFGEELAGSLRRSAAAGARGLKVWKTLGLAFRDAAGELLLPDDERTAPVFEAAGELGLPVLIHTADPPAFFDPVDRHNERLEELLAHPEWSFYGPEFPSHERLMESFEGLVEAHPRTVFVGAHLAGNAEDLAWLGSLLERLPNLYVDISGRISDLGRQPRAAGRFMNRHRERILFGSDLVPPTGDGLERIFRFLESEDEAYEYAGDEVPPPAGRWTISALGLADESLRAIYADNARRILGERERSSNDGEQA
jgi:predicted TIM-barrel fold metal-dependent hydrolase